jgi:hypothetical protein
MLLSKSSGRDKGRTYCNKKQIIIICFQKMHTNKKIYYNLLITLMNVCQSCVLTPPKSPNTDISRYVRGKIFDVGNRTSPNNLQNSKQ